MYSRKQQIEVRELTLGNLFGKFNGLGDTVCSWLDGALDCGVGISTVFIVSDLVTVLTERLYLRLFTDVELFLQKLDQSEFDGDVSVSAILQSCCQLFGFHCRQQQEEIWVPSC